MATATGDRLESTAPAVQPVQDGGRSRVTALLRLALALWLLWSGFDALRDPPAASAASGIPVFGVQALAALHFTLGAFLLSGFMSRVIGLVLAVLAVWQWVNFGPNAEPLAEGLIGAYLVLRGGGAWGMDVYVQMMQDKVRRREAAERAAKEAQAATISEP